MLNKITLFLLLFTVWFVSAFFSNNLTIITILIGLISSIIIVVFVFKTSIMNNKTEFKFLQFNFYSYIFKQLNSNMTNVFKICFIYF